MPDNRHERCNLGARYRKGIEANFLVEKHQGYHYEHVFALNWKAMQGYHCLMHLAHLFNALARVARHLRALYRQLGVRGARAFIRSSCAAPWLDPERMRRLLAEPMHLQLEYPQLHPANRKRQRSRGVPPARRLCRTARAPQKAPRGLPNPPP